MSARNGHDRPPASQSRPQIPGASANYTMIVGGLVACRRCACLLQDTRPARDQHDSFHAALREMYERIGGRS
jgi:hypothetical protein